MNTSNLLKELCSRLPYGVKCRIEGYDENELFTPVRIDIDHEGGHLVTFSEPREDHLDTQVYLSEVKLCLIPFDKMTKEQKAKWSSLTLHDPVEQKVYNTSESFDFLYENHIDARGLIDEGTAVDVSGLNIY